ncbi:parallel beta-helix repeat protein [Antricoccus suffuscus]|uniref:Sensor-like histidine kinase SenX3 n=1 Tax=Antricoccus suffuscus TaxID=1629062 RepID=A0A2T1A750_9ACTN|nr:ATP-binding protein [Antricoccus suffuscus]PRZ44435.1 parallel beta-helix repeat protein [Antricoccus suffuscus]
MTYIEQPRRADVHQTIFLIPLALVLITLGLFRTDLFLGTQFLVGVGIFAVATGAAFLAPWKELPLRYVAIVPTLDFIAIGLCRDAGANQTTTLSLLCFFPAVWLALLFESRGVILATAFTVLAATIPSLLRMTESVDPFIVIRQLLLPLVIMLVTAMLVLARAKYLAQRRELTDQAHDLHFSLAETERNARLLDNVINSVGVGIVVVDADGNDVIQNRAQEPIHALASPPDNPDRTESGHHIYHRDGITPLVPTARAVYRAIQGETFSGLTMNVGKPGSDQRVVSAAAQPMVDASGEREGAVIVFNDITDMSELARNREAFVSAVSHELRTPITSIVGYLDLVRDNPEPRSDETNSYLEVINRNAEQVLRIIEDLLTSAQVINGSIQLKKVPTDISALARATVESARVRADARHIALQAETVDLPKSAVDPARIAQVLDNLVSNAIKYTPEGGKVTVRTFADAAAGTANVEVQDTGVGLSQADLAKLFTPYFRTKAAINSTLPGVGLGLTISRRIVEAHGGVLSVESTPGIGTTFTIGLPCGD